MRLLFAPLATRSHLYPLVPLAWACRAAGHEVRIAGTAGLAGDLLRTGMPAVVLERRPVRAPATREQIAADTYALGPWPRDWALNPHLLDEPQRAYVERLGTQVCAGTAGLVEDLVAFALQWRPDLVVHDTEGFAGPVAAAVLEIPNVRHDFGFTSLPRLWRRLPRGPRSRTGPGGPPPPPPPPDPLPAYARLFERFGAEVRTTPALSLDPAPPSMRLPQDGPWREIRHVAYNGPGCAPRWPSRPAPRRGPGVCLTWGHSVVDDLGPAAVEPYREAIEVIAELGGRSVVVTAAEQIQALGELPAGALAAPWMPLDLVLPHCDAVVHQGGDGTVLTAAAWGLPQLAMTRTPEHSFAGDRLAASGAGLHLRYEELRGDPARRDAVRGAIAKLLGDAAYRDAACGLRGEIAAQPSPAEIVPALEALT